MNLISFGLEYEAKPLSHRNHLCAERRIGPVKRASLLFTYVDVAMGYSPTLRPTRGEIMS